MGDNLFFDLIREKGRDEGLHEGIALGEERGEARGEARGRAEEARRAVLRVLDRRFGAVPERVRAALGHTEAVERLERLLDQAIDCPSLEVFLGLLEAP